MPSKSRAKFASIPSAPSVGIALQRLTADTSCLRDRPRRASFVPADAGSAVARTVGGRRRTDQSSATNPLKSRCKLVNAVPAADADAKIRALTDNVGAAP